MLKDSATQQNTMIQAPTHVISFHVFRNYMVEGQRGTETIFILIISDIEDFFFLTMESS